MPAPRATGNASSAPSEHAARTRELAAIALGLVDVGGLHALTMRRLAAEAKLSAMTLYWYFTDKDAVLDAICQLIDEEITEASREVPNDDAWLEEMMMRAVRVLTGHHRDVTILIQSRVAAAGSEHLTDQALATFDEMLRRLARSGVVGLRAVQLCFLITQGVFMLALACRVDPDDGHAPDARLRVQWTALRDVPVERYPHVRESARSIADDDRETTSLLRRGIRLFTAAVMPAADEPGTPPGR